MDAPEFLKELGTGQWIGTVYKLDLCPVCSGKQTFGATGNGMWGCAKCHKGGKDVAQLRNFLSSDVVLKSIASRIKDVQKPEELIIVSQYNSPYIGKSIGSGFGELDQLIGGFTEGAMTILTGKRGEGKSTWLGQMSLNAISLNHNICFYSGELNAGRFQNWLFMQAAGSKNLQCYTDPFGKDRWAVTKEAEDKIRTWIKDKMVLYDNTKSKASERKTILSAFEKARYYYGSDLFIVDNLMTARYDIDNEKDSNRAQANFASQVMDFARTNNVHAILVAHPRKGESDDINESVAGLGEITNLATNVIQIKKANEKEQKENQCDSILTVSKNREYGEVGSMFFNFDRKSKRFIPLDGTTISNYGW